MTKRNQIAVESLILFLFAAGIGFTYALTRSHTQLPPVKFNLPVMQPYQNPTPSATPTPTSVPIPKPSVASQVSPDGTHLLTMTTTTNKDRSKTYQFVTSYADGTNQKIIYTGTYTTDTMIIPFNTWSPDNKYVFLTHLSPTGSEALIVTANGMPLTDTAPYFSANTLFTAKNTGNVYQETTGWASNTLLIMNSTLTDGTKGPSYWLEIPSKAIIQLSSQF